MLSVDHLVYACPSLEEGIGRIEKLLGVNASPGGKHPAWGTHNAIVSLGPKCYLEIIAPDPSLPVPRRGRVFGIDTIDQPRLVTWAVRTPDLDDTVQNASRKGLHLGATLSGNRIQTNGLHLTWRLTDPYLTKENGLVPFLIEWGPTAHPALSGSFGGTLQDLILEHPNPISLQSMLEAIGQNPTIRQAERLALMALISTSKGLVELR